MKRDWIDFKSLHGNIAGAREAFEDACETLYRKVYSKHHVSQVKVKQGDGGIDIFIGELGVEPILVIQCKFFLENFGKSQQSQIRESFETAINSDKYELKKWVLCIPRLIDIDENAWWFKWKHKKLKEHSKNTDFIALTNGNELIDLLREQGLYNQIFQIEDSLKIDELHKKLIPQKPNIPKESKSIDILFNNYSKKCEPFYLERESDVEFNESLEINNIWVFGKSGFGKTALINRNLIQSNTNYCFCDLSPVTITCSDDVLKEVLLTIEDKFNIRRNDDEVNILKQISHTLSSFSSKRNVIVIDELYVQDEATLKNIADSFIQLVTYYGNQKDGDELKFVVSTIADPKTIIKNRSKASDHFQYIQCDTWAEYDSQLFDLLNKALNLKLENHKQLILENSRSPRVLKNILKKIVISQNTSEKSVIKAIDMAIDECVE